MTVTSPSAPGLSRPTTLLSTSAGFAVMCLTLKVGEPPLHRPRDYRRELELADHIAYARGAQSEPRQRGGVARAGGVDVKWSRRRARGLENGDHTGSVQVPQSAQSSALVWITVKWRWRHPARRAASSML
jgi:hypothetical protein